MTYSITGLDPAQFASLFGLADDALAARGAVRMIADAPVGYPCRVSLDDATPRTALLLVNHVSHEGGPYHASHAIFVTEGATTPAAYRDRIPPALERRVLSLRAFGKDGMMTDATLAQPGEADAAIRRLLADPKVDHVDAHNALRGCFAARIERSEA